MPQPAAGTRVKGESPPRRSPNTARESDPGAVRTARRCAAIPGAMHVLCGMAGVILGHFAAHPRPSSTPHPSKGDSDALEGRTITNPTLIQDDVATQGKQSTSPPSPPALCGHPRRCAVIPGTAEPSPTLWGPVLTGRRHTARCAAQVPPSARPSNRGTDDNQTRATAGPPLEVASGPAQESSRRMQGPEFIRTTISSQVLHAGITILYERSHDTIVSRLPLVYKRRCVDG
jgi:hypothetical protein